MKSETGYFTRPAPAAVDGGLVDHPWEGSRDPTIFVKPVVCESCNGYAVYSANGEFLAFVLSLGDAMIAAHDGNVTLARVN